MKTMRIAVVCRNASGMPDIPIFLITATPEEVADGAHYDRAEALADAAGYEGPFICFDEDEFGVIAHAATRLGLVPRVVVIDLTEGLVHSVRCDTGNIKVICYDESETDENLDTVVELPVGSNGRTIRCRAHIQTTDVDQGLEKARD